MKHTLVTGFAAMVLGLSTLAMAETKSGKLTLKQGEFGPPEDAPKVELGQKVKVSAQFYLSDFFGATIINASPKIHNTADKPMWLVYHVAFFDADGKLIGCVSQSSFGEDGLKPGEETAFGSALIFGPEEELKKAASYQVTVYESEKKL